MVKYREINKFYLTTRVGPLGKCYLFGVFEKLSDKEYKFTLNTNRSNVRKNETILGLSYDEDKTNYGTETVLQMFRYFMIPPDHMSYDEWCSQSGIDKKKDTLWQHLEKTYLLYQEEVARGRYKDSYNVDRGNYMFWETKPDFCIEVW